MTDQPIRPPTVVALDDIDAVPGPATLTWRPVRLALGLRAFGTNAYTAEEAGVDVVEPHDEDVDLAHEELYFVARGRARFIIDGETYHAPAGTYVFVPDPRSHRHAIAEEAGTAVLSFGGPPAFQPSAWEWSFQAAPLFRSDPGRARAILDEGLDAHPESPGLRFHLARLDAAEGRTGEALQLLEDAIEREPELRAEAVKFSEYPELAVLEDDPEFRRLVG